MDDRRLIRDRVEESIATKRRLLDDDVVDAVAHAAELVVAALGAGEKVVLCGNGGSAADATHLAAELVGRFRVDRPPLPALSLTDNVASLTAIGNDYGYAQTFSRQVRALGRPGDVLIALSTSGTSENVVAAVEAARAVGMRTIAFTGASGGSLGGAADLCVRIPTDDTARIQEAYMLLGHTICELAERALFSAE
ncbi:MAG TPA: SIS domain-containing protein [Solirubrobacteraceae bacterium]|nr:SIS domain-containing protein [Solirubrobacteraceae bacterium]